MSLLKKHSVRISGHQTSITLETPFWEALQDIARRRKISINQLISEIDEARSRQENPDTLSSCLRVHILNDLKESIS